MAVRFITLGLLATLAACTTAAPRAPSAAGQTARIAASLRDDANVMAMLHAANLAEIGAGRQAQALAIDTAATGFANMLVAEHATLDREGAALSQRLRIAPAMSDSALDFLQAAEADSLSRAAASFGFDRVYIDGQVTAHLRTLALVDASLTIAQQADLRAMLQSRVRPALVAHLARARQIQARLARRP